MSNTNNPWVITGQHAIRIAERDGVTLKKYNDPIEAHRDEVPIKEAKEIAEQDADLIYCVVVPTGWTGPAEGYRVEDYFPGSLGGAARSGARYAGPDEDGIEPTWSDAY